MAYNTDMIFIETSLFTQRIVQVMDDDAYAELQEHLASHPDAGPVIVGSEGCERSDGEDQTEENVAVLDSSTIGTMVTRY